MHGKRQKAPPALQPTPHCPLLQAWKARTVAKEIDRGSLITFTAGQQVTTHCMEAAASLVCSAAIQNPVGVEDET